VGESDSDRCLYEEINRRLLDVDRGAADTLFINAQNWQTIPRVIGPLRRLGVPAAAVVDLDAVAGPRREWEKYYKIMAVDESTAAALEVQRGAVASALKGVGADASGQPRYKNTGVDALSGGDHAQAMALLEQLGSYGVFVVTAGELESWLPALGIPREIRKSDWIVRTFRALGSNPAGGSYVTPAEDDVWRFVDGIAAWINDPNRDGLDSGAAT
jgi:hypothetical protein